MKFKKCSSCKTQKSFSEFTSNKSSLDGLSFYCKNCQKDLRQKSRIQDPHAAWARATYNGHRTRGHAILFSIKWLIDLARTIKCCPWCGTKLHWDRGRGQRYHDSPSLDRLSNEQEMREDNVAIICHRCNSAKGNSTVEKYLEWLYKDRGKTSE